MADDRPIHHIIFNVREWEYLATASDDMEQSGAGRRLRVRGDRDLPSRSSIRRVSAEAIRVAGDHDFEELSGDVVVRPPFKSSRRIIGEVTHSEIYADQYFASFGLTAGVFDDLYEGLKLAGGGEVEVLICLYVLGLPAETDGGGEVRWDGRHPDKLPVLDCDVIVRRKTKIPSHKTTDGEA